MSIEENSNDNNLGNDIRNPNVGGDYGKLYMGHALPKMVHKSVPKPARKLRRSTRKATRKWSRRTLHKAVHKPVPGRGGKGGK